MSEPTLRSVVQGLLAEHDAVLAIGVRLSLRKEWRELSSTTVARELHGTFRGIVWQASALTRGELVALKSKLAPGGKLLTYVESRRSPLALLRSFVERPKQAAPALHEVCESLLATGFLEPTVYGVGKRGFVVAAHAPLRTNELDQLFEQPTD